jgi:hypothetical protein
MNVIRPALAILALAACGRGAGDASCGFTQVAASSMLLNEFGVEGQTLGVAPAALPTSLPVRLVAGPVYAGAVSHDGSDWIVTLAGTLPPRVTPGFAVLVVDREGKPRGIALYESDKIMGAPTLGTLISGAFRVPLVGIQLDPAKLESPRCPFFPDSTGR